MVDSRGNLASQRQRDNCNKTPFIKVHAITEGTAWRLMPKSRIPIDLRFSSICQSWRFLARTTHTQLKPLSPSGLRFSPQSPSKPAAKSYFSSSVTLTRLRESVSDAGQRLNEITGYASIENQKRRIEAQERNVTSALAAVKQSKAVYDDSIKLRSSSQREVNELLQRKSSWVQADLERFTTLFRSDHTNALQEEQKKEALEQAEARLEKARAELSDMILARYHEEQIWSDKIRRASTWGTWALMGVNVVLFVFVQLALEPWKRQRLVAKFEDRLRLVVHEALGRPRASTGSTDPDSIEEIEEVPEDFLTSADHHEFDHALVDPKLEQFLNDADYAHQGFDHNVQVPHGTDSRPSRSGECALQSASSLPLHGPVTLMERMCTAAILVTRNSWAQIRQIFCWAFDPQPSGIAREDITTACIASTMLGFGIGLVAASF
jgi:hypothetical protein